MSHDPAASPRVAVSLAPMLAVRHGKRALEFYQAAFGAVETYHVESPDGAIVSKLSVRGAEFWLADESPEHGSPSPETVGGASARMILTLPDSEAVFAQALACGAREISPVQDAYGWHLGHLVDPFGHHWEIGYPLATQADA